MKINFKYKKLASLIILSSIFSIQSYELFALDKNLNEAKTIEDKGFSYEDTYFIGPGDVLSLFIFNNNKLNQDIQVISDGTVSIPLIGTVKISGLSLMQAQQKIKNKLNTQLIEPEIQLKLIKQRPIKVSIIGEVERPGIYSLTSNEKTSIEGVPTTKISGFPTVIDAIQKAGGITKNANLNQVSLSRLLPLSNKNKFKTTNLNLIKLITKGDQSNNPYIFDGDIIKIKRSIAANNSERLDLVAANFAPKSIQIHVSGEVEKPGTLNVSSKTVLNQAIYLAGGPKSWRTNKMNIRLFRFNRDGTIYSKRFRFKPNLSVSDKKNPILQDGDIVVVNGSLLAKTTDTIKTFAEPLSGLVSIYSLYKIVNDN